MPLSHNKRNRLISVEQELIASVTAESDALTLGTPANTMLVTSWQFEKPAQLNFSTTQAVFQGVTEFDLEIACDATETITSPQLFGWRLRPVTIADDAVDTVDFANNELDLTGHAYQTGDGPVYISAATTLATGLSATTPYYVRDIGANTIQLHTTRAGAVADTGQVTFSDAGTGTHTIADKQDAANADDNTQRYHWFLYGDLNEGNTITVGAQQGYMERVQHSPLTHYYEVVGSSGTGAQTLVIRCCPVQTVEV